MEQFGPSRRKNRLMSRNNVNSRGEDVWCTMWRLGSVGTVGCPMTEGLAVQIPLPPSPSLCPCARHLILNCPQWQQPPLVCVNVCVNSNCKALWDARMMLDKRYISAVQSNVPNVGCLTCTTPSKRDKPVLNARLHASSTR